MTNISEYKKDRIFLIDEIRGFCIICMVLYHIVYDIQFIFNIDIPAFHSEIMNLIRDFFAATFIFISGVSCNLSRNNLKRGIICFLIGIVMTIATYFIIPDQFILFGILHFLGISMIIFAISEKFIKKWNIKLAIPILLLLFIITYKIPNGFIGIKGIFTFDIPSSLYDLNFIFPFGVLPYGTSSADYFPLLPWIFIFAIGSILGIYFKKQTVNPIFFKNNIPILSYFGKHTLIIYILHQPVIFILLNTIKDIFSI